MRLAQAMGSRLLSSTTACSWPPRSMRSLEVSAVQIPRISLIDASVAGTRDVQFTLRHPKERSKRAVYGFSLERGFYVTVTEVASVSTYDMTLPEYDEKAPLEGALRFLLLHGFFTADEFAGAMALLEDPLPQGPRRVRRVIQIARNFQAASMLR
jgi:hypothetical protein